MVAYETVAELYERNRFLEAYELTRELWSQPDVVDELGLEELLLAGRLAHRLGGTRLSRWLFRHARARDPAHPSVRFYAPQITRSHYDLYEELRDYERFPELPTEDRELAACWLAKQGVHWSMVRQFRRAHALLERARQALPEHPWLIACESEVLRAEDRWQEALAAAETAFEISPGLPAAAACMGAALARCGRTEEAASRLHEAAVTGQSFEVALIACWYLCALAEHRHPHEHRRWAAKAEPLTARLPTLAPLADREARLSMSLVRLDVYELLGDPDAVRREVEKLESPHVRASFENEAHGPAEIITLPVRRVPQQHSTCLPASIAAALGGQGVEMSAEQLAAEITFGGTPVWSAVDWLEAHGYAVSYFLVTLERIEQLIEQGVPAVLLFEWEASGHATTVIGIDRATRTLILHDPAQERWLRLRVDRFAEDEAPLGPQGLAVVPGERAGVLDLIPLAESEPVAMSHAYLRTVQQEGARAAARIVDELAGRHADHPMSRFLKALYLVDTGEAARGLEDLLALLRQYPYCQRLRRTVIYNLHRLGDTARLRTALSEVVHQKLLPGLDVRQPWRYPPTTYLSQYADYLSLSAEHLPAARSLLRKAIRRDPTNGEAYHVLGDIEARDGRFAESVLPFQLGASLVPENDHYARALSDTLRRLRREDEGIAGLRQRADELGRHPHGAMTWATLVEALEDYGRPDEAAEALEQSLGINGKDDELLAYATRFWIGRGDWDRARGALDRLRAGHHRARYLETATYLHDSSGDWQQALTCCEEWLEEMPDSPAAARTYLRLLACRDGRWVALARAELWRQERPGHDEFETIYYEQVSQLFLRDQMMETLRQRLARNPDDAWAWRELGHRLVVELAASASPTEALRREFADAVAGCHRTCPDHPSTLVLEGRLRETNGDAAGAIELYLRSLQAQSGQPVVYGFAWNSAASLPTAEQERVRAELERDLMRTVGPLHTARQLAFLIADRFGLVAAEESVVRWREALPEDSELVEAHADLLLAYGEGRRDAERALALLRAGIADYPSHVDLRRSLARALAILLRPEEIATLEEVLRRFPTDNQTRLRLAEIRATQGAADEHVRLLGEAVRIDPLDERAWLERARQQWRAGQAEEAVDGLRQGLGMMAESMPLREGLVGRLLEIGAADEAVQVAREGVDLYPSDAHGWLVLGQALEFSPKHTDVGEIEAAYRRALSCDAQSFEAADRLAVVLGKRQQFAAARELLEKQVERQSDPSPAKGRLAWLTRLEGDKKGGLDAMIGVLKKAPWYVWGWAQVMDWLEQDEAWAEARALLEELPQALLDLADLRARRLELLARAGCVTATLDEEWDHLLDDFPQHLALHLHRFDQLWEVEEYGRAALVLAAAEGHHPNDPYVLSRRVRVHAHREELEAAIETAVHVWTMPDDDQYWPEHAAWETLEWAHWREEAVRAGVQALRDGRRLRLHAFTRLAEHVAHGRMAVAKVPIPVEDLGIMALMRQLEHVEWDASRHRARLLELANPLDALAYWREHPELCEGPATWQAIGSILTATDSERARDFLAPWRERSGINMYAVANYVTSLRSAPDHRRSRGDDVEEIYASSRDALERLPHDQTVLYLVCAMCETALRRGHDDEFRAGVQRYRLLLDSEDKGFFIPLQARGLPEVLRLFAELLDAADAREAEMLTRAIQPYVLGKHPDWIQEQWLRRLARLLPARRCRAIGRWWRVRRFLRWR